MRRKLPRLPRSVPNSDNVIAAIRLVDGESWELFFFSWPFVKQNGSLV